MNSINGWPPWSQSQPGRVTTLTDWRAEDVLSFQVPETVWAQGDYLVRLNKAPNHRTEYFALGADFKPEGKSLLARFGWAVADAAVDGIFGEANDGVVPTLGSYELATMGGGFPITGDHRSVFEQTDGIHHCNYFSSPETSAYLLRWFGS